MLFNNLSNSQLFTEGTISGSLKNPNEFREAVLYEELSRLPEPRLKEFLVSKEAKMMMENEILSDEVMERLHDGFGHQHCLKSAICQLAKENDDPEWKEFVHSMLNTRHHFNNLVQRYAEQATPLAKTAKAEYIDGTTIPEYFKNK